MAFHEAPPSRLSNTPPPSVPTHSTWESRGSMRTPAPWLVRRVVKPVFISENVRPPSVLRSTPSAWVEAYTTFGLCGSITTLLVNTVSDWIHVAPPSDCPIQSSSGHRSRIPGKQPLDRTKLRAEKRLRPGARIPRPVPQIGRRSTRRDRVASACVRAREVAERSPGRRCQKVRRRRTSRRQAPSPRGQSSFVFRKSSVGHPPGGPAREVRPCRR
jgi:hypothetical protein